MSEPSEFSLAWFKKQFQGLSHGFNRCWAAHQDCLKAVKTLRERTGLLEVGLREAREEIGRQTDEIAELKEAMEKSRVAFGELRKQCRAAEGK